MTGGEVIQGPWLPQKVEQPPRPIDAQRWWHRADNGVLWVRCGDGRARPAPVPLAPLAPGVDFGGRSPHPRRITLALDLRGLYGPEVDEALGVADALDTVVDSWEAGEAVPTLEEVRRLATLTGHPTAFFYAGTPPEVTGPVFLCGRGRSPAIHYERDQAYPGHVPYPR